MPKQQQIVSEAARKVLAAAKIEGNQVKLQSGELERGLWLEVKRVLAFLGGHWEGREVSAYVFYTASMQKLCKALDLVIRTGYMPSASSLCSPDVGEGDGKQFAQSCQGCKIMEKRTTMRSQQEIRAVLEVYKRDLEEIAWRLDEDERSHVSSMSSTQKEDAWVYRDTLSVAVAMLEWVLGESDSPVYPVEDSLSVMQE